MQRLGLQETEYDIEKCNSYASATANEQNNIITGTWYL